MEYGELKHNGSDKATKHKLWHHDFVISSSWVGRLDPAFQMASVPVMIMCAYLQFALSIP
jgi:hypothetical protein